MKKILANVEVMAPVSFVIGWLAGRGTAQDGFANGEVVIGGIVVGLLYFIALKFFKK